MRSKKDSTFDAARLIAIANFCIPRFVKGNDIHLTDRKNASGILLFKFRTETSYKVNLSDTL